MLADHQNATELSCHSIHSDSSASITFSYDDVTADLLKYFSERRARLDPIQQYIHPATIQIKSKLMITVSF